MLPSKISSVSRLRRLAALIASSSLLFAAGCSWCGSAMEMVTQREASEGPSAEPEKRVREESPEIPSVPAPPVTRDRLSAFLSCERAMLEMSVSRFGKMAEAYLDTAHGQRMKELAESDDRAAALGRIVREGLPRGERERAEAGRVVTETQREVSEEIEEKAKECGFASLAEWEAFRKRLDPARKWRLEVVGQQRAEQASEQVKAQVDAAVAAGHLSEEQRDQALARVMPGWDPPDRPALDPPLTEEEIEALEGFEAEELMGALFAR